MKSVEFKVLIALVMLGVIYLIMDAVVLDYQDNITHYSIAFYYKFAICAFLLISITSLGYSEKGVVESTMFHFSVSVLCLWFGLSNLLLSNVELSKYVGLIVFIGCFSLFNVLSDALEMLREKQVFDMGTLRIIQKVVNVLLFSTICLSIYIVVSGKWTWVIQSPFDWGH
ncbi:hypothetical protein [Ferrimonas marina]|nr:hypothetical protein [Ferrimonas marina]